MFQNDTQDSLQRMIFHLQLVHVFYMESEAMAEEAGHSEQWAVENIRPHLHGEKFVIKKFQYNTHNPAIPQWNHLHTNVINSTLLHQFKFHITA